MFKLSDIDHKSVDISTEQDDLEAILKSSVPGLVSDSHRMRDNPADESSPQQDSSATGHRLLVEPSVFNMGLLLPPSLSFIRTLKEIVPPESVSPTYDNLENDPPGALWGPLRGASFFSEQLADSKRRSDMLMNTLTSFLDDFLVNVFHPQLDETLAELSVATFMDANAFEEDPQWSRVAKQPILKGTSTFFSLITAFCEMLDTIPHDQAFSQLIITQMTTYHDKCMDWFNSEALPVRSLICCLTCSPLPPSPHHTAVLSPSE
jgi:hypothetical protein